MADGLTELEWWTMIHAYFADYEGSGEVHVRLRIRLSSAEENEWINEEIWPDRNNLTRAQIRQYENTAATKLDELHQAQRIKTDGAMVKEMIDGS